MFRNRWMIRLVELLFVITLCVFSICFYMNFITFDGVNIKQASEINYEVLLNWSKGVIHLTHLPNTYFIKVHNYSCFKEGTKIRESMKERRCTCDTSYVGDDCGVPKIIAASLKTHNVRLTRRQNPRRIIQGSPFNHEFGMFEIKIHEIGDVVDVFMIGDSFFSVEGHSKEARFYKVLTKPFMKHYLNKVLYVLQDHYPPQGLTDGWFADSYARNHMYSKGISRIKNCERDDLFILLDSDEIPSRDVLLFLKLYDGYNFPISLRLRWRVFGYFWLPNSESAETVIPAITTVGDMETVYNNTAVRLRATSGFWVIGRDDLYSGFHCSWCMSSNGIITKLIDANREDKPRWGDYPEKLKPAYIANLRNNGMWFDNITEFVLNEFRDDISYAPRFVLDNKHRFACLLHLEHPICKDWQ